MKKKGNKRMPTSKQKLIHNPIPTSLFLSDICLLLDEDSAGTIDSFLTKSMFTQTNNEQRCRDGVMNEFLFWCRHPLVPLLFHEVTSLHPPSFQRNDFSTCNVSLQNDELISASKSGDVMTVVSLLNSGADIQTEDEEVQLHLSSFAHHEAFLL